MTFYHLVNCVALAVLPYLATYRLYNLSEYRAFWKCAYAACIFLVSQLVKMLILASLFPVVDVHSSTLSATRLTHKTGTGRDAILLLLAEEHLLDFGAKGVELAFAFALHGFTSLSKFFAFSDFLRLSVELIDLVAIHHVVNKLTLKGDLKFVATGLGWAFAELLAFRVMPFWLEARGSEFSWVHLMSAMEANVNLVYYISVAAMMWALSRSDFNKALQPAVLGLVVLSTYKPLVLEILMQSFHLGPWFALGFKAIYSVFLGVVALGLCTALTEA